MSDLSLQEVHWSDKCDTIQVTLSVLHIRRCLHYHSGMGSSVWLQG